MGLEVGVGVGARVRAKVKVRVRARSVHLVHRRLQQLFLLALAPPASLLDLVRVRAGVRARVRVRVRAGVRARVRVRVRAEVRVRVISLPDLARDRDHLTPEGEPDGLVRGGVGLGVGLG